MSIENVELRISRIGFISEFIEVYLSDGRIVHLPLDWHPPISRAILFQRNKWKHTEDGCGVFWPSLGFSLTVSDCLRVAAKPEEFHKSEENEFLSNKMEKAKHAYIISDEAHARYRPEMESPPRITPPYGSMVEVIEARGWWTKISWLSKTAWVDSSLLGNEEPPQREKTSSPEFHDLTPSNSIGNYIQVGPRGGVYTRTKSGFRRYF